MCLTGRKSQGNEEKLRNKEIGNFKFYSLADIIRVIKLSRSMGRTCRIYGEYECRFFRNMRKRDNL
jgi:hypothetical protein